MPAAPAGHRRRPPERTSAQGKPDATARDNGRSLEADRTAYWQWRETRMADDVPKVIALRELRANGITGVTALQPA